MARKGPLPEICSANSISVRCLMTPIFKIWLEILRLLTLKNLAKIIIKTSGAVCREMGLSQLQEVVRGRGISCVRASKNSQIQLTSICNKPNNLRMTSNKINGGPPTRMWCVACRRQKLKKNTVKREKMGIWKCHLVASA